MSLVYNTNIIVAVGKWGTNCQAAAEAKACCSQGGTESVDGFSNRIKKHLDPLYIIRIHN